ncbi:MAG: cobalamin biosynthesis protein CbiM [Chloroflexi bacterium HGW-Chloroflexi-10]|nr:MAG: cobalamin biosynthesis protein CbiM [Chloroflexi bacterium HGW-Chloroflexi-10]
MLYLPTPMHIPDGFLSVVVSIIFWVISAVVIAVALRKVNKQLGEKEVPLMGILAAAIFAGQMLNFSVTGGTSGHLMGAAIATILVGPWAAVLVMTSVVSVQAIVFQDGGLLVLGANIFNMGIIGVAVSYTMFRLFQKISNGKRWGLLTGSFLAGWTSIFIASLVAALQLALSNTSPANLAIPAMGGIHALIGIGEGLITLGAVAFLIASRRDLVEAGTLHNKDNRTVWIGGAVVTVILAVLSPIASSHPDGLEWVAEKIGFLDKARGAVYNVVPDYVMPGLNNEALATIIAGIIGAIIVFAVAYGVASSRKKSSGEETV